MSGRAPSPPKRNDNFRKNGNLLFSIDKIKKLLCCCIGTTVQRVDAMAESKLKNLSVE